MNSAFEAFRKETYKKLGLNIARQRKEAGLTQEQLAEKIHISKDYLGHIEAENSEVYPSFDVLLRMAYFLELPLEILLS